MRIASSWRLSLALAVIAVLAVFVAGPAAPRDAEATVNDISANTTLGENGGTIQITVQGEGEPDAGTMTVTTTGGGVDETFALVSCTVTAAGDCDTAFDDTTPTAVTLDTTDATVDGDYTLLLTMTLDCSEPEQITVTATDDDNSDQVTIFCVEELSDPHLIVEKQSDDSGDFNFDWDASSGDCVVSADDGTLEFDDDGSFDLEDNDQAFFWCETSVNLLVTEDDDADFVEIDDCDEDDDGVDDVSGASVDIDISDIDTGDTIFCTWVNDEDAEEEEDEEGGPVSTVSIVLSSSAIDCGGSVLVQVVPRNSSGGPAEAGTTISVSSSLGGSFQPASSLTSGFPISLANFLYTAPSSLPQGSSVTTITARAGNAQATANLQLICGVSPAPAVTATPAPLSPPSAGSGGLADTSSGRGYLPMALAFVLTTLGVGTTLVLRRSLR